MRQIILKDSGTFELIPNVRINSTTSVGTKGSTAWKGNNAKSLYGRLGQGVGVRVFLGSWHESFVKRSLTEEQRNVTE